MYLQGDSLTAQLEQFAMRGYVVTHYGADNDGGEWAYLTRSKTITFPVQKKKPPQLLEQSEAAQQRSQRPRNTVIVYHPGLLAVK